MWFSRMDSFCVWIPAHRLLTFHNHFRHPARLYAFTNNRVRQPTWAISSLPWKRWRTTGRKGLNSRFLYALEEWHLQVPLLQCVFGSHEPLCHGSFCYTRRKEGTCPLVKTFPTVYPVVLPINRGGSNARHTRKLTA